MDELQHAVRGYVRTLVFPDAYGCPANLSEPSVGVDIASHVPADLLGPVVRVRHSVRAMRGASVPVAAIDEDRDTQTRKCHIGSSAYALERKERIHAIAETQAV